jgi:hypothetical protein
MKQARQLNSNQRQGQPTAVTLPGVAFALLGFLTLVALVVVAERAGLPPGLAQSGVLLLVCVLSVGLVWNGRTVEEAVFTGRALLMRPVIAGIVAGAVLTGMGVAMLRPVSAVELVTILTGQVIGIAVAHALARWRRHRAENTPAQSPVFAVVQGVLHTIAGGLLGLICLSLLASDLAAPIAGQGHVISLLSTSLLLVLLPLIAVAIGGLQASLVLCVGLVSLAMAGCFAIVATGLFGLGTLPLPFFSEGATLAAIAEAKARWFATPVHPVLLTQWPALAAGFSQETAGLLFGSACISCFILLSVFPALPLQRRSVLVPALSTSIVLPLCLVAAGGYAIEAAGFQFVGASVQRPPAGLLEAARNGFVTVCNAAPLTVDALRAACGVSPRDVMLLDWQQVQINRSYLSGGLLSAMGYPVATAVLARMAEPLLLLAGLTVGFWIAARGLGLGILARDRMTPGLASLRLGFVRLAALLLAAVMAIVVAWLALPTALLWPIAAIAAGLGLAISFVPAQRQSPAVEQPKSAPAPRRFGNKAAGSTLSETP